MNRRGQAILIVVMICLVLGILFGTVMRFQMGQIHLLSRSAKDFLALCAAEAGVHCVLAEMKADYQFVTHGNPYIPQTGWPGAAKHRPFLVGEVEGLELDHATHGTYSGRVVMKKNHTSGEFKVRVKLLAAKNSLETKTVEESHRYFALEAIGRVDDSYRKITAVLEKTIPGSFLAYDGQVLDMGGFGPYRLVPGIFRRGRLYGHELLKLTKRGIFDAGVELQEMEKISTPGHLQVSNGAHVTFRNGKEGRLRSDTDSSHPDEFETYPETAGSHVLGHFVLDGLHGAKSEKFPVLNPNYWKQARDPAATMLNAGGGYDGFAESKWRNPAKPAEVVYDLDFGWTYDKKDKKELLYSTVPLRIWGCPSAKALTIFCEKDVYLAGDFNQNPRNPQNYDLGWRDYSDPPENGTDKNGVMILSAGRIWFDYTNPMLFLRNEMMPVIDFDLAMCLGGKDLNQLLLGAIVFPPRFGTNSVDPRLPMTALNFPSISSLFALPKTPPEVIPVTMAGLNLHPALKDLRTYLDPSTKPEEYKVRFPIKSFLRRQEIVAKVGAACYMTGFLTKGARDNIINTMLKVAAREIDEEEPDATLGPWNIADRIFRQAVTHPKTGFRFPEMTVNALLIESGELNARWNPGDSSDKVQNEIGNIQSKEARCFPFVGPDTRMLLRHLGGTLHLRNRPASPYLDGKLRNDFFVVRRNIWDSSFVRGGGDYFPPYPPSAFNLSGWQDTISDAREFASF